MKVTGLICSPFLYRKFSLIWDNLFNNYNFHGSRVAHVFENTNKAVVTVAQISHKSQKCRDRGDSKI